MAGGRARPRAACDLSFRRADVGLEPAFDFVGFEAPGALLAGVGDAAGGVDTFPDDFVDLFEERLGAALGFIRAAGLVVQVPLALDVRVLQTVGPAAELARTGLG